jgi:hypothetical protein
MLRCGATMKTASPLGQGGLQGGLRAGLSGRLCQTGHDNPLKAAKVRRYTSQR